MEDVTPTLPRRWNGKVFPGPATQGRESSFRTQLEDPTPRNRSTGDRQEEAVGVKGACQFLRVPSSYCADFSRPPAKWIRFDTETTVNHSTPTSSFDSRPSANQPPNPAGVIASNPWSRLQCFLHPRADRNLHGSGTTRRGLDWER
ncbi:hypothetical protein CSHISOI_11327 [Colletotrichum shisoi]|uniref:Uncharacterized protein n=1 Tax=Colletotrichum shisoi TaxID=2078593 RepID=A0A5Q4BB28_9PEZI|nr:hypothetical protein CSHISOI_11327 [Colletotrichum shisoi]